MPYVPINVDAYTAAFCGAVSGMAVSGWIESSSPAAYAQVAAIAGAFSEAFDTAWNSATPLNNLEYKAITSVVQTDFKDRGPGPLAYASFAGSANWARAAAACAALVLESDIWFAGQGINPGSSIYSTKLPIIDEPNAARVGLVTDAGSLIRCTNAAGCVVTLNPAVYSKGDWVVYRQVGLGAVSFAGAVVITPPVTSVNTTAQQGGTIAVVFLSGAAAESFGDLSDA